MSKRSSKINQSLSQLGQAFMLPIAILPVAGLLLGLGGALTNDAAIHTYSWLNQQWLQTILKIMNFAGNAVFSNLALIFSIGLAVGLAKGDKGTAGLAGGVAYLVYSATIAGFLQLFSPKNTIDTGVLGAIVIGSTVAYLHNHYRKVQLPQFLGFFGGSRFIPIISSLVAIVIGAIFFVIWPPIQSWLTSAGYAIAKMGSFGSFLYGFLLRLTGAVGLHHTIYPMFWYTALGGTADVAGKTVVGAQNIFFAQLADPNHHGLFTYGTRFFAGRFATMMFGLPGAALAMYLCLPKINRKKDGGLYLSGGLTSFLTGITEPIEYTFLFVAPWLYVIHAFLDGVSFYVADIMNIRIGNSFSGGFIDYLLFGVLQGQDKTNWPNVLIMGIIWFFLYFFIFTLCIKKFHVGIPGMEVTENKEAESILTNSSTTDNKLFNESAAIITALGGINNIETVSACATRLRVSLKDNNIINEDVFKMLGAPGVLKVGSGIQAIFGGKADIYSQEINDILTNPSVLENTKSINTVSPAPSIKPTAEKHNETISFSAPVNGIYTDLGNVKDDVFSKKMMGEGFAIIPSDGLIYSPINAKITSIFKTKHAIGLITDDGLEVLLHLGLDTVELEGKPFDIKVKTGDTVTTETLIAQMDIDQIKKHGKDPIVLTLITNSATNVASVVKETSNGTTVSSKKKVFEVRTK
ncbi:PTS system glucose-specific IIC component [Lactobacillus colini]|uniref:PTS system glucose-specific IIC component n=1 Tax=Lactobacillus colini TaxID=1819254 RepID=A0ABS4MEX6_9LACO|nr:PTS transporter subunit IIABC [Lactobacillus colini]MBP2058240.1 PTS system glucose-specific IIC component [Lactobacillus colini]